MQPSRVLPVAALVIVASCGPPRTTDPGHPGALSAQEHQAEAVRHEHEAEEHAAAYQPPEEHPTLGKVPECFDQPLAGVPTSGTEDLPLIVPCWTAPYDRRDYHRRIAEDNLRAAQEHRARAAELIGTERRACAGLGQNEISHSPFFHREDITAVKPYQEEGELRGARVYFRKVPGLTTPWLRHAIGCHQARAAVMGYSTHFQPYCPLALEGVAASVHETKRGFEVVLRADDELTAAAVLGRAEDLLLGE